MKNGFVYLSKENGKITLAKTKPNSKFYRLINFSFKKSKYLTQKMVIYKWIGWNKKTIYLGDNFVVSYYRCQFKKYLKSNLNSSLLPYDCAELLEVYKYRKLLVYERLSKDNPEINPIIIGEEIIKSFLKENLYFAKKEGILFLYQHSDLHPGNIVYKDNKFICFDLDSIELKPFLYDFFRYAVNRRELITYFDVGYYDVLIKKVFQKFGFQYNSKTNKKYKEYYLSHNPRIKKF